MKTLIFILLSSLSVSGFCFNPSDSVGTTTRNGVRYVIHEVNAGETFYSISRKYNVNANDIIQANGGSETLSVGQKILVPSNYQAATSTGIKAVTTTATTTSSPSQAPTTHTVAAGEGLYGISKKYGVTIEDIVAWNGLSSNNLSVGQVLLVSAPIANKPASQLPATSTKDLTHTVQKGEGLYGISKKYGVSIDEIKKLNGMTSDALNLDQVLIIKKGSDAKQAPLRDIPATTHSIPDAKKDINATENFTQTTTKETVLHPTKAHASYAKSSHERKEETGVIGLTVIPQYNTKFSYGLHKTAPAGTIVKVTNKTTGKSHWVRIMGTLDSSETSIMKVNRTVMEKIGEGQTSFQAEISYVQ